MKEKVINKAGSKKQSRSHGKQKASYKPDIDIDFWTQCQEIKTGITKHPDVHPEDIFALGFHCSDNMRAFYGRIFREMPQPELRYVLFRLQESQRHEMQHMARLQPETEE